MATRQRVLCDTNILLDIFDRERPAHEDALALLWYAVECPEQIELIAPISSFKDAYYVLGRLYHSEQVARESIQDIMGGIIAPVDMLASYGPRALSLDEPDFEDALVRVCAEDEGVAVIVSGDKKAFEKATVPSMTASQFLDKEGFDYEQISW